MFEEIVKFVHQTFGTEKPIALHEPRFVGNEQAYVLECLHSTFVSSVGPFVARFEQMLCEVTGAKYAVATVNGTAALHAALLVAGVEPGDEVITQALSFAATANAIAHCHAKPIFLDVDRQYLGLCPERLAEFLDQHATLDAQGQCVNKQTGARIRACVPMHVFGHPAPLERLVDVCNRYHIMLIEDAAESLGSLYQGRHTGTYGAMGILSFNGNKIVTTGGGGMILTNDASLAKQLKHLTTTAKKPHAWKFEHDQIGYNYRLPNINAALGCAQLERLSTSVANKRELAALYRDFFAKHYADSIQFFTEQPDCHSNYWLNAIFLRDQNERDALLEYTNAHGVMTRPVWTLLNKLPMYQACQTDGLENALWIEAHTVNLPSSVRLS